MSSDDPTISIDALEDVRYLSRSANRVFILDALTEGQTSRRELAETTRVSRTTLDRIVNELDDRGWAKRTTDGDYLSTPAGTYLMQQFRPFLDSIEAIQQLDEALEWLPNKELHLGLEHFHDAYLRRPEKGDLVDSGEQMETKWDTKTTA